DEIGRMEFFSEAFKAMLRKLIDSDKKIIATLHRAYVEKYRKQGIFIWLEKDKLQEVKNKIISLIGI
ncbi:MAG: nucleoside-triphosphatase, partial [Candidatus Pacearchaeota archaeon]